MLKYCIELFSQIPFNLNKYSKDPDLELDPDLHCDLDPDPPSEEMLDLDTYPDPYSINADPQPWKKYWVTQRDYREKSVKDQKDDIITPNDGTVT